MLNLYLFKKYWGKHKKRLFSLILSIILLSAAFVFLVLNERAELRSKMHQLYDVNGAFCWSAANVTDEQIQKVAELPLIDKIGKISAAGKVDIAGSEYTVGYYENTEAGELNHLPLTEGRMPKEKGEIAIPAFILEQISPFAKIGDMVSIDFVDNEDLDKAQFKLCGIIGNELNRDDSMEFIGNNQGFTIVPNEIDYPIPSLYVCRDDLFKYKTYTDILISVPDDVFFGSRSEKLDEVWDKLWEICGSAAVGAKDSVLEFMSGMDSEKEGSYKTEETDNMLVIRILSYMLLLVSVVSMVTGIVSILPDRVESLRLLKCIGMSKQRLLSLFITEFMAFWLGGTAVGVGIACGLHEMLLLFKRLIGLPAFRGYAAEFIVEERTLSPFVMPVILSLVIALAVLIIPVKNILTMTLYKKPKRRRLGHTAGSFKSAYAKMTGSRLFSLAFCISIITVMCAISFGYCYYTQSGKGKTYLTAGSEDVEENYYKVEGINLKKTGCRCTITAPLPSANGMAVYDGDYGISHNAVSELSRKFKTKAWGLYPAECVLYGEDDPLPDVLKGHISPWSEKWEYYEQFKTKKLISLQILLLNETLLDEIGGFDKEDIIIISSDRVFPYEAGDSVPMAACLIDDGQSMRLDTLRHINAKITKQLCLADLNTMGNELLENSGMFNYADGYAIAMTARKAEELGLYHPAYSRAFIDSGGVMTDKETKEYAASLIGTSARIVTLEELEHNAGIKKLSADLSPMSLFVIMFILYLITTCNLLSMNVSNNREKYSLLHSLGMPVKKLRRIFVMNTMKHSIAALIIGVALSFAMQWFLQGKYDEYMKLVAAQQELIGADASSGIVFGLSSSEFNETDELYVITKNMESLKSKYMLEKEMWIPDLKAPVLIIAAAFMVSGFAISFSVSQRITGEDGLNDD